MLNNKNQAQNYMAYEIIISENMNKKEKLFHWSHMS